MSLHLSTPTSEIPSHIFGSPSDEMLSWVAHLATEAHCDVDQFQLGQDRLLASALLDALVGLMDYFTPDRVSPALARTCISGIAWIVDGQTLQQETFHAKRGRAFEPVLRAGCRFLRAHLDDIREEIFHAESASHQDRVQRLATRFGELPELDSWGARGIATLTLVLLANATGNTLIGFSDSQIMEAIVDRCATTPS